MDDNRVSGRSDRGQGSIQDSSSLNVYSILILHVTTATISGITVVDKCSQSGHEVGVIKVMGPVAKNVSN